MSGILGSKEYDGELTFGTDPSAFAALVHNWVADRATAYYRRFSTVTAVDDELNRTPRVLNVNRSIPHFRCSAGIIAAKLVDRPNLAELADIYCDVLANSDRGFYLPTFKALLADLATM